MYKRNFQRRRDRQEKRVSVQNVVFAAVTMFVLMFIIVPAVRILFDTVATPEPIKFSVEDTETVDVFLDGQVITMPLEEYLVGVVSAEMPASYEIEALKAQAVAARTYTLYKKNHGGCSAHSGADICTDSTHCQAYLTADEQLELWGEDTDTYLQKVRSAIQATAGQVLLYDGEEIQVFYHACSGGTTENSENVYAQALPYLVSVQSEGEEAYAKYHGEVSVSLADFETAMQRYSPSITLDASQKDADIGNIVRYESGRIESIKIGDETFSGREIREIFSLNSANFTVTVTDVITFTTTGYGHGVGMSQTGANAMAQSGATYEEILTHYYTGVTITQYE